MRTSKRAVALVGVATLTLLTACAPPAPQGGDGGGAVTDTAGVPDTPAESVTTRVFAPLLVPGILAAAILVLVRTVGLFELTFLVSGPGSDTLLWRSTAA